MLHGEDAQLPARPDDALRQAEGVERGVEQAAEPARSAGLAPLLCHVLVDGGDPVAAEQGGKGCAVDHQDAVETGVGDVVAVHPEGDAQLVRAAEPGGFRHGDLTDAVHRLRSFPLGLSVRGREPVHGAEVLVEGEVRIEGLAFPAPEAFDKGCFAFGYKVGNLAVGELLLPLATEDGKPTIDVAALGDLRVKEDATGTALGARDMPAVRHRYLYLQEFFGNLGGIDLDALAEGVGIHLPALDLGEGGLPLPGHLDIGDALVLHYLIHGKPLAGRYEALLLPAHIVPGKEGFDDGGTGGGRADAVPFQAVPQLVVLQIPAAMLHRRKEAALGVQGTGLGLFLYALRRLQGERLAGLQGRQSGCSLVVLVPLATHGTPSGRPDDRSLGGEHAVPRRERDGGNVLEATGGKGFEQAGGYHVVHRALVGGQLAGQTLGDDERMVVGNFPRIHAAAVERSPFQGGGMGGESRVPLQQGDAVGYLVEHILREVAGAGTGIAQHLLLVKRLGDGEGLVRREAVPAVRLFLQGGQVIEQGRFLAHLPALHVGNLYRPRCGYSGEGGVCRRKGFRNAIQRWRRKCVPSFSAVIFSRK